MDNLQKEEIKNFLINNIQSRYNSALYCFSGLQVWAQKYTGPYSGGVRIAMAYLSKRNSNPNTRVFSITNHTLEEIMKKINQEVQ